MCSWCKILVPVSGEQASSCAGPLSGAFTLAKRFGAQVEGVYLAETLEVPAGEFWQAAREAALFESGRPVLVVPTGEIIESAGETLLIAWKDDAAAARALATALPLIAKARYICVMAIGEESKVGASLRAAHRYLRLHNPDVYIELVEAGDRLAGELLLAKADLWDDVILLMGAYGHSRLRERVTGGGTEYILQHTTAPVLMAH
jgi:nucleotide-binding universal stress UspA family protein